VWGREEEEYRENTFKDWRSELCLLMLFIFMWKHGKYTSTYIRKLHLCTFTHVSKICASTCQFQLHVICVAQTSIRQFCNLYSCNSLIFFLGGCTFLTMKINHFIPKLYAVVITEFQFLDFKIPFSFPYLSCFFFKGVRSWHLGLISIFWEVYF
jgi:hypothetical protein